MSRRFEVDESSGRRPPHGSRKGVQLKTADTTYLSQCWIDVLLRKEYVSHQQTFMMCVGCVLAGVLITSKENLARGGAGFAKRFFLLEIHGSQQTSPRYFVYGVISPPKFKFTIQHSTLQFNIQFCNSTFKSQHFDIQVHDSTLKFTIQHSSCHDSTFKFTIRHSS